MADTVNRKINIYINGKEVENSLNDINKAIALLTAQTKKMTIGSEEYNNHVKKIAQLKSYVTEHNNNLKQLQAGWAGAATKAQSAMSKIGMSFTQAFSAFTAGNLVANAVSKITSALSGMISDSSTKYKEADAAAQGLKFSVMEIAGESEIAYQKLSKQADALKGVIDDEDIRNSQATLIDYGLTTQQVFELMPVLIDTAAKKKKKLSEIDQLVIGGLEGQGKGLKKLGIEIDKDGTKTEKLASIQEQLGKFAGSATAALETETGALLAQENALGDAEEKAGKYTVKLEVLWNSLKTEAAESAGIAIGALQGLIDIMKNGENAADDSGQSILDFLDQIEKYSSALSILDGVTNTLLGVKLGLSDITEIARSAKITGSEWATQFAAGIKAETGTTAYFEQLQKMINDTYTLMSNEKDTVKLKKYQDAYSKLNELYREKFNVTAKVTKVEKDATDAKIDEYTENEKIINQLKLLNLSLGEGSANLKKYNNAQIEYLSTTDKLNESLKVGKITQAEYDDELAIAEKTKANALTEYTTALQAEIEEQQKLKTKGLADDTTRTEKTDEWLKKQQTDYVDFVISEEERLQKEKEQLQDAEIALAKQASDSISTIVNNRYDKQLAKLDMLSSFDQKAREKELSNVNLTEAQKDAINKKYDIKEAAREKERRKIEHDKAVIDKASAIFNIFLSTAQAVMKSVAAFPLTGGMPFAGIDAALGALQIAAVMSKPVPEFYEGGFTAGERYYRAGERGKTEYIAPGWQVNDPVTGPIIQDLNRMRTGRQPLYMSNAPISPNIGGLLNNRNASISSAGGSIMRSQSGGANADFQYQTLAEIRRLNAFLSDPKNRRAMLVRDELTKFDDETAILSSLSEIK